MMVLLAGFNAHNHNASESASESDKRGLNQQSVQF